MKHKIKLYNKISPIINKRLPDSAYDISENHSEFDAAIVRSAKLDSADFPAGLLAIARAGAGYNNIPVDECTSRGIAVFNTPGANANAVKELVLCALLLSCRDVVGGLNWVKSAVAEGQTGIEKIVEKKKGDFAGNELAGKKLGVIGLGAIGVMVANSAVGGLGMEVMGYDPYMSLDSAWHLTRSAKRAGDINELLEQCDFVTLHLPLTPNTKGMIGEPEFSRMKKGAVLLNFARGGLVDNDAVAAALADGRLGSYVTDFPDDSIAGKAGVLAIPHLGASTEESEENCAEMAADQLRDYLENGNIVNSVNLPGCTLPRTTPYRLAVINQNIKSVLSGISAALGEDGLNIDHMLNKSRGDMAYTIVDVSGLPSDKCIEKIKAIDGVVRIRVIV